MPLKYHPKIGALLICDYGTGFVVPEMVKRRPVVVVSPRLRHRNELASVVPLSTSAPDYIADYHCKIEFDPLLPAPFDAPSMWVKADMLATVGFHRLNLIRTGRDQYGKRRYLTVGLGDDDLQRVQVCIRHALGLHKD